MLGPLPSSRVPSPGLFVALDMNLHSSADFVAWSRRDVTLDVVLPSSLSLEAIDVDFHACGESSFSWGADDLATWNWCWCGEEGGGQSEGRVVVVGEWCHFDD